MNPLEYICIQDPQPKQELFCLGFFYYGDFFTHRKNATRIRFFNAVKRSEITLVISNPCGNLSFPQLLLFITQAVKIHNMNSYMITYAVSLHFSTDVSDIISQAVRDIAEATSNNFIIENKIPPHITIGAFHARKEDEARLLQLTAEFARTQKAGVVHFSKIDNFKGKVLFLKGEKDFFLTQMNKELHSVVLREFESGENGYYLPEIWCPHTTLATRLSQGQFAKALSVAEKIPLPLEAKACEIGFYQCSPFLELNRFVLK